MEIKVGDRFKVVGTKNSLWTTDEPPIYTVTKIDGNKVHWDCQGRIVWYRIVNKKLIEEHVLENSDLIKL